MVVDGRPTFLGAANGSLCFKLLSEVRQLHSNQSLLQRERLTSLPQSLALMRRPPQNKSNDNNEMLLHIGREHVGLPFAQL